MEVFFCRSFTHCATADISTATNYWNDRTLFSSPSRLLSSYGTGLTLCGRLLSVKLRADRRADPRRVESKAKSTAKEVKQVLFCLFFLSLLISSSSRRRSSSSSRARVHWEIYTRAGHGEARDWKEEEEKVETSTKAQKKWRRHQKHLSYVVMPFALFLSRFYRTIFKHTTGWMNSPSSPKVSPIHFTLHYLHL